MNEDDPGFRVTRIGLCLMAASALVTGAVGAVIANVLVYGWRLP